MNRKIIKSDLSGILLVFLGLPVKVFALTAIPTNKIDVKTFYNKLVEIMNYAFGAGLAVAIIMMVWGGITYMTAGGDDTKIGTAKKRLIWGLVGAAIIVGAWAAVTLLAGFLGITVPTDVPGKEA